MFHGNLPHLTIYHPGLTNDNLFHLIANFELDPVEIDRFYGLKHRSRFNVRISVAGSRHRLKVRCPGIDRSVRRSIRHREREDFVSQSTRQLFWVFIIVFLIQAAITRQNLHNLRFRLRASRSKEACNTRGSPLSRRFARNGLAERVVWLQTRRRLVSTARTPVETRFEEAT